MAGKKNFLDHAYGLESVEATKDFYADWAASYDAEIKENGYATPGRCAQALTKFAPSDAMVLDVGCGTGLSGLALAKEGFSTIDGCDMTDAMLDGARDLNLYRHLWISEPKGALDFNRGPYDVVAAIGVIGIGAARMTLFYDIIKQMQSGSFFVFSFNDHTLEDPSFEGALSNVIDGGGYSLLFKEYGPHFPKRDMNSNVYVLQKQ